MRESENEFRAAYIDKPDGRPVTEIDASIHQWVHITDPAGRSLWLDVRGLGKPGQDGEHLCIDVHPFHNGEPAVAAPWGMTQGLRHALEATGLTTLGWPAVDMPILVMAEQPERLGK